MRLTGFLATCILALVFFAACGDSGSGTGSSSSTGPAGSSGKSPPGARTQIAIIVSGTGDYWKAVHAGAEKARSETVRPQTSRPSIDILWREAVNQTSSQPQISVTEDMIALRVAAIILAPGDADSLKDVVERAVAKRIPVIIIDSEVNSAKPRAFVGTDEQHGGDRAGQFLGKLLGAKGRIIILHAQTGQTSAALREAGLRQALKEEAGLVLESTDRDGGATSDTAYSAAKRLLSPYVKSPGALSIDGIFTPTESTTQGMLRALRELKLAGKVKFVGYGNSAELVKGIENGEIQGLAVTRPMNVGYLAVKTAILAIKEDKKIDKRTDSGTLIVTKENLAAPETQEILHPDLDQWLK